MVLGRRPAPRVEFASSCLSCFMSIRIHSVGNIFNFKRRQCFCIALYVSLQSPLFIFVRRCGNELCCGLRFAVYQHVASELLCFSVSTIATFAIRNVPFHELVHIGRYYSLYIRDNVAMHAELLDEWTVITIGSSSVLFSLFVYWLSHGLSCVSHFLSYHLRSQSKGGLPTSANTCSLSRRLRRHIQLHARRVESKRIRRRAKLLRESGYMSCVIFACLLLFVVICCEAIQAFIPILACVLL